MKKGIKIITALALAFVLFISGQLIYLNHLSSAGSYPEDDFLNSESNKTAVIITAHDDDAVSMAGTIIQLCEKGWDVKQLTFYQSRKENETSRKGDFEKVAKMQGISEVEHHDIVLRENITEIEKPWRVIPRESYASVYKTEAAEKYIADFIEKHQPSVIFSLDDSLGGYGHPDHIIISKLARSYCEKHQADSGFSVKRIYQALFDPQMNERILKDIDAYQFAKQLYGFEQSPTPDVYVSIIGYGEGKKQTMLAYKTEQNSLRKFWPYYSYYPAGIYFGIFDKEYYRLIDFQN